MIFHGQFKYNFRLRKAINANPAVRALRYHRRLAKRQHQFQAMRTLDLRIQRAKRALSRNLKCRDV